MRWSYLAIFSLIMGCNSGGKNDRSIFDNAPDSVAKKYCDSIAYLIEKSISWKQKGFPSPRADSSYYLQRPYYDSTDRALKEITVYETRADTFVRYTHFYFWRSSLIAIRVLQMAPQLGAAMYYFKNNHFLDSTLLHLHPAAPDTLLKRGNELFEIHNRE